MSKSIKYAIVFYGAAVFCILIGLSTNESNAKEETIKYLFLFTGLSIGSLYLGLNWEKPSDRGGLMHHKYGAISLGLISGIYSIYLLLKITFQNYS